MRIISGKAKGVRLCVLRNERTSPILDSVKESLFNVLGDQVKESMVLDLFSGTGTSGLEALSRGAKRCLFVDNSALSIAVIHKNLANTKLSESGGVLKKNVLFLLPFLKSGRTKFDLIFVTPPYKLLDKECKERGKIFAFLDECSSGGILAEKGIMMLQHHKGQLVTNSDFTRLHVVDQRAYGNTGLTFLRTKTIEE
ncbi:MAG: 16S rRNA (guanine(966)-N(2))-methyltransferase RsmD [Candidatus Scalindua sp. AMX11]|nr:MAG: 16S rRNA (guanine(966)-N(2))-methyltransferase RsmD [Candidatus Scalindua sp.]NOG83948.1 16S rRNA (guanine(966)-N(2))-methyltransferase RsmD [Planctomycetota bacterium]RZV88019.1 MAG: 16S rRNA (guanine(966)-N(2))-methyltransferase RsmD [Candidatus Scalindua sp. SCAELEC01]TDE64166.1 MAG: 16S rRNA (guanine(966)-N(2))-methyltransferase RsmD [Candidatus Scalindua sp. AMX11]GJQ58403.1 MAG: RNA methyltransferase [Candidatus Scalindua sp.]